MHTHTSTPNCSLCQKALHSQPRARVTADYRTFGAAHWQIRAEAVEALGGSESGEICGHCCELVSTRMHAIHATG